MHWTAHWIWDDGEPNPWNYWLCARRVFELDKTPPTDARLHITADTRYVLWVNGRRVGQGPVRAFPRTWRYDTYDLGGPLQPGRNVLAVLVHHWGVGTFQSLPSRAGLLAQLEWAGGPRLVTDGKWRVHLDTAYRGHGFRAETPRICCQQGWMESFTALEEPPQTWIDECDRRHAGRSPAAEARLPRWQTLQFDDSDWQRATILGPAGMEPWTDLRPRDVPFLTEEPVQPVRVIGIRRVAPPSVMETTGLRRYLLPGYDDAAPAPICGLVAMGVRNRRGPRSITLCSPGDTANVSGSLRVNGIDVEKTPHAVTALNSGYSWTFELPEGDSILVWDVSGTYIDWTQNLVSHDSLVHRVCLAEAFPKVVYGPFESSDAPGFLAIWNARSIEELRAISAPYQGVTFIDSGPNPFLRVAYARPLDGPARVGAQDALCAANREVTAIQRDTEADVELLIDFGRMTVGFWEMEMEADAGTMLTLTGFESVQDGHRDLAWGMNNTARYQAREGWQTFRSVVRRGCRYLSITVHRALEEGRPVQFRSVRVIQNTYPVVQRGAFQCSDALLNRIWEMGRYTARLCMSDTYEDCPTYEQAFWVGDARNEGAVNHYAFGEYALTRRCLLLAAESLERSPVVESHVPSGYADVLTTWSLLWALACEEYYQVTADAALVRAIYAALARQTEALLASRDAEGLVHFDGWNLLDWAPLDTPRDAACAHTQAWMVMALAAQCRLAAVAGRAADVPALERASDEVRRALNGRLWDETRQAYRDCIHADGTPSETFSQGTNTIVLLAGAAPPDREAAIRRLIAAAPEGFVPVGSPFCLHFSLEALAKLGQHEALLDVIRERWGFMVDHGATTCWETFPGWEPNGRYTRSHCHAWSAGPTYLLSRHQLGVAPLEPGFSRALIAPEPAGLQWARGRVPTPHGVIEVAWQIDGGHLRLEAHVPDGVEADVRLSNGWVEVERQGNVVKGVRSGETEA